VIVGFSLNDFDVVPTLNRLGILTHDPAATARPTLLDRSEFVTLLRWLTAYARGDLRFQLDLGDAARTPEGQARLAQAMPVLERATETLHRRFYEQASGAQWEKLRAGFAALAERARTVPVLVAIFPESYQVGVADPDLTPQRRLLGLCRDVGLRCLDLRPAFAAAGEALFQDVQHPNARGHAVAAAAIAEALRDLSRPHEPVR
jgi:hypothetical protein